jgi:LysM domain
MASTFCKIRVGFMGLAAGLGVAHSDALVYLVQPKDNLSKIAHQCLRGPIYGNKGTLAKLLKGNPEIKHPNLIYPGQTIALSKEESPLAKGEVNRSPVALVSNSETTFSQPVKEFVSLTPFYSMIGIHSFDLNTGKTGNIGSSISLGAELTYHQSWTPQAEGFVTFNLSEVTFSNPSGSIGTISDSTRWIYGLGLGMNYEMLSPITLGVEVAYQRELFMRAQSTTALSIDTVLVPSISAKLFGKIYESSHWMFGAAGIFTWKGGATTDLYSVNPGTQIGGTLSMRTQRQSSSFSPFETEFGYFRTVQNTSITDQTRSDILLKVHFNLPLN